MTATDNGVHRMARKGIGKFAIGDDEPITLDIIQVHDEYWQADASMRNDKDEIPKDQQVGYNEMKRAFFQNITAQRYGEQYPNKPVPTLTHAEAHHFLRWLQEEAKALLIFTVPVSPEAQSSAPNTTLRFQM